MRKRSLARQVAMKILFQASLVETDHEEAMEYFRDELRLAPDVESFARELVTGTTDHLKELDAVLNRYLDNWDIARIGNVEKAILRLAAYELIHHPEVPARVTINEAIELSKEYSTDSASKFINGVLDKVSREHLPAEAS